MGGPGAMRLDAAFGATHSGSGLGNIQFFPITQQEGFTLTRGQVLQSFLHKGKGFSLQ